MPEMLTKLHGIDFNPRSPRGGATKLPECSIVTKRRFQSTLPTRGSDHHMYFTASSRVIFQSTLPTRGSDALGGRRSALPPIISIHAPHEGERRTLQGLPLARKHFNPRSPRGGATMILKALRACMIFQSTLPTRGSDLHRRTFRRGKAISIHAPHEGERQRKSAFVYSISANLLNIIHCGTVTRAVSRRRIALFRLFSVRRSGVFMYTYASH